MFYPHAPADEYDMPSALIVDRTPGTEAQRFVGGDLRQGSGTTIYGSDLADKFPTDVVGGRAKERGVAAIYAGTCR